MLILIYENKPFYILLQKTISSFKQTIFNTLTKDFSIEIDDATQIDLVYNEKSLTSEEEYKNIINLISLDVTKPIFIYISVKHMKSTSFKSLKSIEENEENQFDLMMKNNIHYGVTCNYCLRLNIQGRRYKCETCLNFDLCEECYNHHYMTQYEEDKRRNTYNLIKRSPSHDGIDEIPVEINGNFSLKTDLSKENSKNSCFLHEERHSFKEITLKTQYYSFGRNQYSTMWSL